MEKDEKLINILKAYNFKINKDNDLILDIFPAIGTGASMNFFRGIRGGDWGASGWLDMEWPLNIHSGISEMLEKFYAFLNHYKP